MSTVSTSTTTTPTMSPVVIPTAARGPRAPARRPVVAKRASPIDPFLLKYIKVGTSSGLNLHDLYFSSVNDNFKSKSIKSDIQKYIRSDLKAPNEVKISVKAARPLQKPVVTDPTPAALQEFQQSPILNYSKSPIASLEQIKLADPQVSKEKLVKTLPVDYMQCGINDLITLIARMLSNLISINDSSVPPSISHPSKLKTSNDLTRYHSRTPPKISTNSYLARLTKFNNFNPATLLTTIYYIDLLSYNYQPFFNLNSWTVHRFLLVATMLSQKSMEDFFYTNDHYAKVGGVALNELNCLELDFLSRVDWKVVPSKSVNGVTSIRYAEDVLRLYYNQLIELMGRNADADGIIFMMDADASDDDMDDDDDYDDDCSRSASPARPHFDSHGPNGSPHLKRKLSNSDD